MTITTRKVTPKLPFIKTRQTIIAGNVTLGNCQPGTQIYAEFPDGTKIPGVAFQVLVEKENNDYSHSNGADQIDAVQSCLIIADCEDDIKFHEATDREDILEAKITAYA